MKKKKNEILTVLLTLATLAAESKEKEVKQDWSSVIWKLFFRTFMGNLLKGHK